MLSIKPHLERFLARLISRSVLDEQEKHAVMSLTGRTERVQPNRDFVALGETVDHSCLVASGLVGRFGQNVDGKRQITARHIAGDMPDLHSVVQPSNSSPMQALSAATIIRVPHVELREMMARHPALAEALWRDCMVDASILAQWVVNVGRRDARTRVAHLLCEMAARLRVAPARGDIFFHFLTTQEQLADATGLTSVHVNRTLKSLRDDNLASINRQLVHIPDWSALADAGEFDIAYLQQDLRPEDRLRIVQPS